MIPWNFKIYPSDLTANTTVEEPVEILDLKLEAEAAATKTKREAFEEEEEEGTEDETEEKCRVDMWRCLSKVSCPSAMLTVLIVCQLVLKIRVLCLAILSCFSMKLSPLGN